MNKFQRYSFTTEGTGGTIPPNIVTNIRKAIISSLSQLPIPFI